MSNSLEYNGIDLSTYGLTVLASSPILATFLKAETVQLPDLSLATQSISPPKPIELDILVHASSLAQLQGYLDAIKLIVAQKEAKQLILDVQDDRYWMARFQHLRGQIISPIAYRGELAFVADDPLAYKTNETSSDHNIDADPDTVVETVGGTAYIKPIYTLTAGENLTDITLKVENTDTDEELQWEGSLANTEELEIDVDLWIVKKEGVADMATVSGQVPRLVPASDNHIKVTDFSNTGTLNIKYRDAYL
jgi:hypothetical protein